MPLHGISMAAKHRMNAGTTLNHYIWDILPRQFMYRKVEWQHDGIDFSLQEKLVQAPKVSYWLHFVVLLPSLIFLKVVIIECTLIVFFNAATGTDHSALD